MLTLYVSRFSHLLIMVRLNRLGTGPLINVVVDLGDGVMHYVPSLILLDDFGIASCVATWYLIRATYCRCMDTLSMV